MAGQDCFIGMVLLLLPVSHECNSEPSEPAAHISRGQADLFMGSREEHQQQEAAFARAVKYCEAETPKLFGAAIAPADLDESQRSIVQSCYEANPCLDGPLRFDRPTPLLVGRVTVRLFDDKCPRACENFRKLCTGEKGAGKTASALWYKGNPVHRLVKGTLLQAGDITRFDGSGGESIWAKKFNDEKPGLAIKFDRSGQLAMANSGKNSNTSQFFLTMKPLPTLNGKHVVFGEITSGLDVLERIDAVAAGAGDVPRVPVWIGDCGVVPT